MTQLPFGVVVDVGGEDIVKIFDSRVVEKRFDPKTFLVKISGDVLVL